MTLTRRATLALAATPLAAQAQAAWPTRPVRLVVPDAPGGGNDTTARVVASQFERTFGVGFPIENRAGAGGRIGVEHDFRSAPDGTTLLLGNAGSNGITAALTRDLPYDPERDFVPVSLLVAGPNALGVNPRSFAVNSVAELLAMIRARPPGHCNCATAGAGSPAHLSAELCKAMTGTDLVHVPFRGAAGMAQAVVSGDAPFLIANLVNILPFVQRGEIRLLAVTSLTRWPALPDIPTLHERGLPGFETLAWNGLFGPPGLWRGGRHAEDQLELPAHPHGRRPRRPWRMHARQPGRGARRRGGSPLGARHGRACTRAQPARAPAAACAGRAGRAHRALGLRAVAVGPRGAGGGPADPRAPGRRAARSRAALRQTSTAAPSARQRASPPPRSARARPGLPPSSSPSSTRSCGKLARTQPPTRKGSRASAPYARRSAQRPS